MPKIFIMLILFSLFADATGEDNKQKLKKYKIERVSLSIKLKDVASKILQENRKIKELKKKIKELKNSIKVQEELVENKKDELSSLIKSINNLKHQQTNIESHLNKIIAKQYAMTIFSQSQKSDNTQNLVKRNILATMQQVIRDDFNKLNANFLKNDKVLNSQILEVTLMKNRIIRLKSEKDNLSELKKNHDNSLSSLKIQNKKYKNEILKISSEQETIRKTLKKLKIIDTIKIPSSQKTSLAHVKDIKVRQIGSSYRKSSVSKYRGAKTISPLKDYEVIRKFGTYNDPIYKIKLFSESVKLRAKKEDAKVMSVFSGKVVYAQETKFLGKVVIIKCQNEMNIIYGHLSKISPYLNVGNVVKKGSIIGRVKRDLTFEVTKKNRHINPLRLIK